MLEAEYLIFCREIQMSPHGINLLGAFGQVRALKFPMPFPHINVQVMLRAKKPIYGKDLRATVAVEFENEEILKNNVVLKDAKALKNQTIPVIVDFPDMVFEEPGDYYFKFYLQNKLLITRLLQVTPDNENVKVNK